jgi:hypothetical protein
MLVDRVASLSLWGMACRRALAIEGNSWFPDKSVQFQAFRCKNFVAYNFGLYLGSRMPMTSLGHEK